MSSIKYARYNTPIYDFLKYDTPPVKYLPILSDPTKEDSDGDGLIDGEPQYYKYTVNGGEYTKLIAPTDPAPMSYTGPKNLWKTQISQMKYGVVGHEYGNDIDLDVEVDKDIADMLVEQLLSRRAEINYNKKALRLAALYLKEKLDNTTQTGAYLLNFVRDENSTVYHSQPETWQRNFGYNELYDELFKIGSYMNYGRIEFEVSGKKYALWAWKGDYWNLQSGAEVGLYVYNDTYFNTPQYDAVDFEVPMTLSLYNCTDSRGYENLFNWAPIEDQWWITGFNPTYMKPNPDIMVSVASIDLSCHEDLYFALCNTNSRMYIDEIRPENLIFDNATKTVWLQWYTGGVA